MGVGGGVKSFRSKGSKQWWSYVCRIKPVASGPIVVATPWCTPPCNDQLPVKRRFFRDHPCGCGCLVVFSAFFALKHRLKAIRWANPQKLRFVAQGTVWVYPLDWSTQTCPHPWHSHVLAQHFAHPQPPITGGLQDPSIAMPSGPAAFPVLSAQSVCAKQGGQASLQHFTVLWHTRPEEVTGTLLTTRA